MEEINLVQNDRHPDIYFTVKDLNTGVPADVTNATVRMHFRRLGEAAIKATIVGTKPNGGADGYVRFVWPAGALDTPGAHEGEVEVEYLDGTKHTVFPKQPFRVRPEIG